MKQPDILILDEATSALDAESETLVNQALQALLRGDNTTISIAHRLSTIQRSDTIICIGSDGKVAQMGSYRELVADKEGAFAKLMKWQMSGAQEATPRRREVHEDEHEELTEEERMRKKLQEHDRLAGLDPQEEEEAVDRAMEEETQWESAKVKDVNQQAADTPMEKTGLRDGGAINRGKGYGGTS